jgi:hypothetical protein
MIYKQYLVSEILIFFPSRISDPDPTITKIEPIDNKLKYAYPKIVTKLSEI